MISYNNRRFRTVENDAGGEVNEHTIFLYSQEKNIVTAIYKGGAIISGQLMAISDEDGNLDMRYHHVNTNFEILSGICRSTPEMLPGGKIRLHEEWQWSAGKNGSGKSIVEEF